MSAAAVRARGRAAKRLESALAREALALEAAVKAQTQRGELVSDLEVAKRTIERLAEEVGALKKATAVRDEPAVPRSPPAKGGLPKVRPDESDDPDESVRAESVKGTDRSSAGSDGEDDDGGSGSDSAKSTTARKRRPAVGELAKDAPDLARQLQLVDKANTFKYMIAHGRTQEEEVSSDGSDDADAPTGALARGGARSLQLGSRQTARLEHRLQKHHETVSSPARVPAAAEPAGTPKGSASGSRKVAAAGERVG